MNEHGVPLFEGLNGKVVGRRNDDGSWTCECGDVTPSDMALYMHRRYAEKHKAEKAEASK